MDNSALIQQYADEFIEKMFYFCLKKCGDPVQAEDLASEINCNIITQLTKSAAPQNFNAWVWAIARNRYSKWAQSLRKQRETVMPDNVDDYEIANGESIVDSIINTEQLKILRRELAFVTREYREILIAYYIDGKKTGEIAQSLRLPKGTVVSKLHRIRKKLKEGFEMSREFGKLSYNPENVGFVMNGQSGKDGAPWSFVSRTLAKNAMLAAYRNPMTADELAIEMGIALPYMEDELEKLVHSTLMKKNGDKYETAIFIVSARAQERCYNYLASIAPELTQHLIKSIEYQVRCLDENGVRWHEGYQDFEDMKWAYLMRRVDSLSFQIPSANSEKTNNANIGQSGHSIRPSGGEWDLMGLENCTIGRPPFIGLHGVGETPNVSLSGYKYQFEQFKFKYDDISEKTPVRLSEAQCRAIVDCVRKSSTAPKTILDELVEFGYLKNENSEYVPTFWVTRYDNHSDPAVFFTGFSDTFTLAQKAHYEKLTAPAIRLLDSFYLECREAITQEIPAFLRDDEYQIAHTIRNIMFPRASIFMEALNSGWLSYDKTDPDSAKRRMLGAYMIIG